MTSSRDIGPVPSPGASGWRAAPVVACWIAVVTVVSAPYLLAALAPPPGRLFVGTFHWIDDFCKYLSFARQAEDGALVFRNAFVASPHRPALFNLEWLAVGWISRALDGQPFLAYRLLGIPLALLLLRQADGWLRGAGLPATHRGPALALVATGGGLGGLLFTLTDLPAYRCADLATGVFPSLGLLFNAHFVAGTALLALSLHLFATARGPRGVVMAALAGSALGVVRPYDFVLLAGVRSLAVVSLHPAREWVRRLVPLLTLLPVVAYNFWLFYLNPAFSFYRGYTFYQPGLGEVAAAVGPALLMAATGVFRPAGPGPENAARRHLWIWVALALAIGLLKPVHFASQFLVGVGLPLLVLAAVGLSGWRPSVLAIVAALSCSTAVVALRISLVPDPNWFVPAERLRAVGALRPLCHQGDLLFAPADMGLLAVALTRCTPYVAHAEIPGEARRMDHVREFYGPASPERRRELLDGACATHLVLPGDDGEVPVRWLGSGTTMRRSGRAAGSGRVITVYARVAPPGCGRLPD